MADYSGNADAGKKPELSNPEIIMPANATVAPIIPLLSSKRIIKKVVVLDREKFKNIGLQQKLAQAVSKLKASQATISSKKYNILATNKPEAIAKNNNSPFSSFINEPKSNDAKDTNVKILSVEKFTSSEIKSILNKKIMEKVNLKHSNVPGRSTDLPSSAKSPQKNTKESTKDKIATPFSPKIQVGMYNNPYKTVTQEIVPDNSVSDKESNHGLHKKTENKDLEFQNVQSEKLDTFAGFSSEEMSSDKEVLRRLSDVVDSSKSFDILSEDPNDNCDILLKSNDLEVKKSDSGPRKPIGRKAIPLTVLNAAKSNREKRRTKNKSVKDGAEYKKSSEKTNENIPATETPKPGTSKEVSDINLESCQKLVSKTNTECDIDGTTSSETVKQNVEDSSLHSNQFNHNLSDLSVIISQNFEHLENSLKEDSNIFAKVNVGDIIDMSSPNVQFKIDSETNVFNSSNMVPTTSSCYSNLGNEFSSHTPDNSMMIGNDYPLTKETENVKFKKILSSLQSNANEFSVKYENVIKSNDILFEKDLSPQIKEHLKSEMLNLPQQCARFDKEYISTSNDNLVCKVGTNQSDSENQSANITAEICNPATMEHTQDVLPKSDSSLIHGQSSEKEQHVNNVLMKFLKSDIVQENKNLLELLLPHINKDSLVAELNKMTNVKPTLIEEAPPPIPAPILPESNEEEDAVDFILGCKMFSEENENNVHEDEEYYISDESIDIPMNYNQNEIPFDKEVSFRSPINTGFQTDVTVCDKEFTSLELEAASTIIGLNRIESEIPPNEQVLNDSRDQSTEMLGENYEDIVRSRISERSDNILEEIIEDHMPNAKFMKQNQEIAQENTTTDLEDREAMNKLIKLETDPDLVEDNFGKQPKRRRTLSRKAIESNLFKDEVKSKSKFKNTKKEQISDLGASASEADPETPKKQQRCLNKNSKLEISLDETSEFTTSSKVEVNSMPQPENSFINLTSVPNLMSETMDVEYISKLSDNKENNDKKLPTSILENHTISQKTRIDYSKIEDLLSDADVTHSGTTSNVSQENTSNISELYVNRDVTTSLLSDSKEIEIPNNIPPISPKEIKSIDETTKTTLEMEENQTKLEERKCTEAAISDTVKIPENKSQNPFKRKKGKPNLITKPSKSRNITQTKRKLVDERIAKSADEVKSSLVKDFQDDIDQKSENKDEERVELQQFQADQQKSIPNTNISLSLEPSSFDEEVPSYPEKKITLSNSDAFPTSSDDFSEESINLQKHIITNQIASDTKLLRTPKNNIVVNQVYGDIDDMEIVSSSSLSATDSPVIIHQNRDQTGNLVAIPKNKKEQIFIGETNLVSLITSKDDANLILSAISPFPNLEIPGTPQTQITDLLDNPIPDDKDKDKEKDLATHSKTVPVKTDSISGCKQIKNVEKGNALPGHLNPSENEISIADYSDDSRCSNISDMEYNNSGKLLIKKESETESGISSNQLFESLKSDFADNSVKQNLNLDVSLSETAIIVNEHIESKKNIDDHSISPEKNKLDSSIKAKRTRKVSVKYDNKLYILDNPTAESSDEKMETQTQTDLYKKKTNQKRKLPLAKNEEPCPPKKRKWKSEIMKIDQSENELSIIKNEESSSNVQNIESTNLINVNESHLNNDNPTKNDSKDLEKLQDLPKKRSRKSKIEPRIDETEGETAQCLQLDNSSIVKPCLVEETQAHENKTSTMKICSNPTINDKNIDHTTHSLENSAVESSFLPPPAKKMGRKPKRIQKQFENNDPNTEEKTSSNIFTNVEKESSSSALEETLNIPKKKRERKPKIVHENNEPDTMEETGTKINSGLEKESNTNELETIVKVPKRRGPKSKIKEKLLDDLNKEEGESDVEIQKIVTRKRPGRKKKGELEKPLHPRLLLVSNREDLDKGETVDDVDVATLKKNEVKCGLCKNVMPKSSYEKHLKDHYGIGWIEGKHEPIDLTSFTEVLNRLVLLMKTKKLKCLTCKMCNQIRKSALGFMGHIETCGLSEEEALVECEHCHRKVKPYTLAIHLKCCREKRVEEDTADPNKTGHETDTERILNSSKSRLKRKSVIKAEEKFKEISEKNRDADLDQYIKPFKKNLEDCLKEWDEQIRLNGEAKCAACKFTGSNTTEMEIHNKSCIAVKKYGFKCSFCGFYSMVEYKIREHLKERHSSKVEHKKEFEGSDSDAKIGSESEDDEISDFYDSNGGESENTLNKGKRIKKERDRKNVSDPIATSCWWKKVFGAELGSDDRPRNQAKKWADLFYEINYSKCPLFTYAVPIFEMLDENYAQPYIPRFKESMKFYFTNRSELNSSSGTSTLPKSGWTQLKRFESILLHEESLLFTGGSITTMSWIPLPKDIESDKEYLIFACKPDSNKNVRMKNPKHCKTIIMIWEFHKKNVEKATLLYIIPYTTGPIHQIVCLPSGGYAPEFNRLALVALATTENDVKIFSLPLKAPQNCDTSSDDFVILDIKPSIILTLDMRKNYQSNLDYYTQCVKMVWSQTEQHLTFIAGYANGFVARWELSIDDNINLFEVDNVKTFIPVQFFKAAWMCVTALELHYDDTVPRWLLVASENRDFQIFDLCATNQPHPFNDDKTFRYRVKCASWPIYWPNILFGVDNDFSILVKTGGSGLIVKSPLNIMYKTKSAVCTSSTVTDVKHNPWHDAAIFVQENGDCIIQNIRNLLNDITLKSNRHRRFAMYTDIIRLDGKNLSKEASQNATCSDVVQTPSAEYGLVFSEFINLSRTRCLPSDRRNPPYLLKDLTKMNCLATNTNYAGRNLLAIAYENGIVRIKNIDHIIS